MSLFKSEYEMKIPFHDLDPMDIVWHGNYVKYMEQARCDMFDKIGYTYYDMKDDDRAYPIAKMQTKFIRPLSFNQEVIIRSSLEEIEPTIRIKYKIFEKGSEKKIFEGETTQIGVIISSRETTYTPSKTLKQKLGICDEE